MRARGLKAGQPVSVVAVSGPVDRARLDAGIREIASWGHPVLRGRSLLRSHGYLAGKDAARAADLNAAIRDPGNPAIFFARGGWGAARILDRIDLDALRRRDRVLLGFSDLTTLFMALQRPGRPYPYRYGPTVAQLGDAKAWHRPSLVEALWLRSDRIAHPLGRSRALRGGRAEGKLIGGCLSLLVGLLGTPWDVPWEGCILFWEDVNEEPYAIDRMLTSLRLAGKLRNLAGMIVGRLAGCEPRKGHPSLRMREIVADAVAGERYPVVMGFPAGHVASKRTLLMGAPARLDTGQRSLVIEP